MIVCIQLVFPTVSRAGRLTPNAYVISHTHKTSSCCTDASQWPWEVASRSWIGLVRSLRWPTHDRAWIGYVLFSVRRPYSTAPSCKSVDRESENCGYSSPGNTLGNQPLQYLWKNIPQEKQLSQGKPMSQVKSSQETQLSHKPKTPTAYQREKPTLCNRALSQFRKT